jgi:APA family basic amino acid/polyamine antiporter
MLGFFSMDVSTGSWTPISGVTLISAISAALVGSMFQVLLGKEVLYCW